MRYSSPLRYPGGKAALAPFIERVIELNGLNGCIYYEPYAGGAGVALSLLRRNVVNRIEINDADIRVYSFWHAVFNDSNRFVDHIQEIPLTIDEWRRQKDVCDNPTNHGLFDVGFAAFFMNRCNRSGVLSGAGPIGGYSQKGPWRLDVRFNKTLMAERILSLAQQKDRIIVSHGDALCFLKSRLPFGTRRSAVFAYLDPPYVIKGQRLYLNAYENRDHASVASYLKSQRRLPWVLSYDDSELVRKLYKSLAVHLMPINYSLQEKRTANELIITPQHVTMPAAFRSEGSEVVSKSILREGDRK